MTIKLLQNLVSSRREYTHMNVQTHTSKDVIKTETQNYNGWKWIRGKIVRNNHVQNVLRNIEDMPLAYRDTTCHGYNF